MNIGIILAGGTGTRLGYGSPKQFVKVAGKMIIEHTLNVFNLNLQIDQIFIIGNAEDIGLYEDIVNINSFHKVKKILIGGETRSESSVVAINACSPGNKLIFHDAVRPLVSNRIIDDCILGLDEYNAIDVAIPSSDTVVYVKNELIKKIPNRERVFRGQTPQAFNYETIRTAYDLALKDPSFKATDDCGVVKNYIPHEEIHVIPGEYFNIKLTYEEDLFLLDKLFQVKSMEVSSENDNLLESLRDKVIVVFGGSYGIGEEIVKICRFYEAKVFSFSRSQNGVDVSNINDVRNALSNVFKEYGRIHYVINTAAVLNKEPLINMEYEAIRESLKINYFANVIIAKESFKYLKETHGGILFFTSSSYTRGRAMYSIYSSLKAGVVNLVQGLSDEWENHLIKVNCINPERTKTPMRVINFGNEDPDSLLDAHEVGLQSVKALVSNISGQVIDVKKK